MLRQDIRGYLVPHERLSGMCVDYVSHSCVWQDLLRLKLEPHWQVQMVSEKTVLAQNAYMLFYAKEISADAQAMAAKAAASGAVKGGAGVKPDDSSEEEEEPSAAAAATPRQRADSSTDDETEASDSAATTTSSEHDDASDGPVRRSRRLSKRNRGKDGADSSGSDASADDSDGAMSDVVELLEQHQRLLRHKRRCLWSAAFPFGDAVGASVRSFGRSMIGGVDPFGSGPLTASVFDAASASVLAPATGDGVLDMLDDSDDSEGKSDSDASAAASAADDSDGDGDGDGDGDEDDNADGAADDDDEDAGTADAQQESASDSDSASSDSSVPAPRGKRKGIDSTILHCLQHHYLSIQY